MNSILSAAEYDRLVHDGLRRIGLSPDQAVEIASSRWPMRASDCLAECAGRGLTLELEDLTAFLRHKFKTDHFDDGTELVASSVGWLPRVVNELLSWAIANGRGEPADQDDNINLIPAFVSVADMLQALRSESITDRLVAGFTLAKSLGIGLRLQGEDELDVTHISGPAISKLIGAAIAGEPEAVEALEQAVTTECPARSLEAN
jgi:hypothetical protein